MYSTIDIHLSDCFCANNNNNIGDVSKLAMSASSGNSQEYKRKKCGGNARKPKNLEIRKEEVMAIRSRFPNKIPVIVQKYWKDNQLPQLDKSKFLVPQDITMSQFQTIIRNRMRMSQNQALYLLVNDRSMLSLSLTLGEVYADHAGPNGFLYITYASQEVFGCDAGSSNEKIKEKKPEVAETSLEARHRMDARNDASEDKIGKLGSNAELTIGSGTISYLHVQNFIKFSLIQRIIDSDKKYNNTKSRAVIYCFTNPDNTVTMDLEIDGKSQKIMKKIEHKENPPVECKENSFSIKTEQGDTVTCKHEMDINIVPKGSREFDKDELNRVTFSNADEKSADEVSKEVDGEIQPSAVRHLIENFPTKRMEISSTDKDQISSLLEQIQKMKTGLERLQEIALQFNCSERFGEDVNFLINNVRPHLQQNASKDSTESNISPKT